MKQNLPYWSVALVAITIFCVCQAQAQNFQGKASWYNYYGTGGTCSLPYPTTGLYTAAINESQFDLAAYCGACAEVTNPANARKVTVRIDDKCPGCPYGGLDLEKNAFAQIADLGQGIVDIQWRLVACPNVQDIKIFFKDGSDAYWAYVQVREHRQKIASLAYRPAGTGAYSMLTRTNDNYFKKPGGGSRLGPGPFDFKLTSHQGEVIEVTGIPLSPGQAVGTGKQFAADGGGGPGNIAPTVSIGNPRQGQQFEQGQAITIQASANDQDGHISKVSFYIDGTRVAENTSTPYTYTWSGAHVGNHSIYARAVDNLGLAANSSTIDIQVIATHSGGCDGITAYVPGTTYAAGQQVSHQGKKYACIVGPWCSSDYLLYYEPGKGIATHITWEELGTCGSRYLTEPALKATGQSLEKQPKIASIGYAQGEVQFKLTLDTSTEAVLTIYNLKGDIVKQWRGLQAIVGQNLWQLPISSLSNGVYLFRWQSNTHTGFGKFMVK